MKTYVPAHVIKSRAHQALNEARFYKRRAEANRALGKEDRAAAYDIACKVQMGIYNALIAVYDSSTVSENA